MSPHDFFYTPHWRAPRRRRPKPDPDFLELMERYDQYQEYKKEKQEQKDKEKKANEKKPPSQAEGVMHLLHWFALTVTFGYPLGWLWWNKVLAPLLHVQ